MSRRRRSTGPKWDKAFTSEETSAVLKGLSILYKRTLFHLVAPRFTLPHLPDVCRALVDESVWDLLNEAQRLMVPPRGASYSFYKFAGEVPVGSVATIDMVSKRFLPNRDELTEAQNHPEKLPAVLHEYAVAAGRCRDEWIAVRDLFNQLNSSVTRSTAAYYWPCASALMALGGTTRHDLADITRPGQIPAAMTVPLRDTSAFVMQHTLLPAIDSALTAIYEGDEATGVAAQLALVVEGGDEQFTHVVWPIAA